MGYETAVQQLTSTLIAGYARTGVIPGPVANLGKGDGSGTLLLNNGQPGMIYLHDPAHNQQYYAYMDPSRPLVPMEDGHPEIESMEVTTGYEHGSDILKVQGINTQAGQFAAGTQTLMQQFWNAGYWATPPQIAIFRPYPTTPASTAINVDIYMAVLQPSTNTLYGLTSITYQLFDYIDALAAGEHQFVLPAYDRETQAMTLLAQPAVASAAPVGTPNSHYEFGIDDLPDFSGINSNLVLTVPLELYYGQTGITESSFYRNLDARQFLGGSTGAGSAVFPDRVTYRVIIGENYQANFREEVVIEDDGELVLEGRLYIG